MKSQLTNSRNSGPIRYLNMTSRFRRWLPEEQMALLPQMHQLIAKLKDCPSASQLDRINGIDGHGVVSYRAQAETGRPCIRFNIIEADAPLPSFLRQASAPFEVLQLACAGLQYHWRSDLAKVLENQAPMVGRVSMLTDRLDIVADHLAIPVFDNRGLICIRGWFAFSHPTSGQLPDFDWSEVAIVRRSQRSRQISLPARLLKPETPSRARRFWQRKSDAPVRVPAAP